MDILFLLEQPTVALAMRLHRVQAVVLVAVRVPVFTTGCRGVGATMAAGSWVDSQTRVRRNKKPIRGETMDKSLVLALNVGITKL